MKKNKEYEIYVVSGVEGPSIYLNHYRIAGPKPWGGGAIIHKWTVTDEDLAQARMSPDKLHNYYQLPDDDKNRFESIPVKQKKKK